MLIGSPDIDLDGGDAQVNAHVLAWSDRRRLLKRIWGLGLI